MTAPTIQLVPNDSRECPKCHGRMEFFTTLRKAEHPEAREFDVRRQLHFHTVADCQSCGEVFEVRR